ncbi:hypothetical protein BDZ90DRAFT_227302 [Jaminaea rosea]|uniref:Secreted protein n=1 Tax=Jaminaea rosea TaxID=1569628 RepID=A0A316USY3_9BASI|nr:hypothetical protein BDZ90DRAFT_227302 [Jaminaea rosea]PWN26993.1 hypothetical protein BDZ90DRAFT_227302 [Jaminaea rosea]
MWSPIYMFAILVAAAAAGSILIAVCCPIKCCILRRYKDEEHEIAQDYEARIFRTSAAPRSASDASHGQADYYVTITPGDLAITPTRPRQPYSASSHPVAARNGSSNPATVAGQARKPTEVGQVHSQQPLLDNDVIVPAAANAPMSVGGPPPSYASN